MPSADLVALVLVSAGVYPLLVSPAVRSSARCASRVVGAVGDVSVVRSDVVLAVLGLVVASLCLALHVPTTGQVQWVVVIAVVVLTWKTATMDFDLRFPSGRQLVAKLLLVPLGAAGLAAPPVLIVWLAVASGPLHSWQHHTRMAFRLVKAFVAFEIGAALVGFAAPSPVPTGEESSALVILLGAVVLSHYAKPAWSKARLGPHWWSWAWDNRTHYLLVSAYNWGWARFVDERAVLRLAEWVRRFRRPLQVAAFLAEFAAIVAFVDRRVLVVVMASLVAFHLAVAATAGILFWESACCVGAFVAVLLASPATGGEAFGPSPAVLVALLVLLSAKGLLWHPSSLGWWDGPLTDRVYLEVETDAGTRHLPNLFMCPFEREFGRFYGYVMLPDRVLHGPLGGMFDRPLVEELIAIGPDHDRVRSLVETHGKLYLDEAAAAEHTAFLGDFFARLNAGARKGPLVGRARWLKAPGGQIFYWGQGLPLYRGGEPVRRIVVRRTARYYDGTAKRIVVLEDEVLRVVEVPAAAS